MDRPGDHAVTFDASGGPDRLGPGVRPGADRLDLAEGLEAGRGQRQEGSSFFLNEASLLRLASAVLSEISDDWETERAYLTKEAR